MYGPLAWALGTLGPTFGYGPLAWALGTLGTLKQYWISFNLDFEKEYVCLKENLDL